MENDENKAKEEKKLKVIKELFGTPKDPGQDEKVLASPGPSGSCGGKPNCLSYELMIKRILCYAGSDKGTTAERICQRIRKCFCVGCDDVAKKVETAIKRMMAQGELYPFQSTPKMKFKLTLKGRANGLNASGSRSCCKSTSGSCNLCCPPRKRNPCCPPKKCPPPCPPKRCKSPCPPRRRKSPCPPKRRKSPCPPRRCKPPCPPRRSKPCCPPKRNCCGKYKPKIIRYRRCVKTPGSCVPKSQFVCYRRCVLKEGCKKRSRSARRTARCCPKRRRSCSSRRRRCRSSSCKRFNWNYKPKQRCCSRKRRRRSCSRPRRRCRQSSRHRSRCCKRRRRKRCFRRRPRPRCGVFSLAKAEDSVDLPNFLCGQDILQKQGEEKVDPQVPPYSCRYE